MQATSATSESLADGHSIYFNALDLLKLMLREKGIHEGLWMLQVEFTMGVGNFGPSEDQALPTSFIGVARLGMLPVKVLSPSGLVVDAAVVNPREPVRRRRVIKGA